MSETQSISTVAATGPDAPHQLRQAFGAADLGAVIVFGDPAALRRPGAAETLQRVFGDTPVAGCTTAGEFGPDGYRSGTLTAIGFPRGDFTVAMTRISDLKRFTVEDARRAVSAVEQDLLARGKLVESSRCFAVLLADGLSKAEESLSYLLQGVLGPVPLFGGSAGDGLQFGSTEVLIDGRLHSDAGVLLLIRSERPFALVRTQHLTPTDTKLVVTGARTSERVVTEFNGQPAAAEYAANVGVSVEQLTPEVFAKHPLLIRMGGNWYVRSIQKVNDDGSLSIYCAIDEGLVLTLGRGGVGLVDDLRATLEEARRAIGHPRLVLGCDCILRRIEAESEHVLPQVRGVFAEFNVVGFNTYGEQTGAVHVNQTFAGVAFA